MAEMNKIKNTRKLYQITTILQQVSDGINIYKFIINLRLLEQPLYIFISVFSFHSTLACTTE